jgi:peptidoglycan/LPS O-acetylase OafA/YrhL
LLDERCHAIDKLRASMILTVVIGHAMLPYLTLPRRFTDPQATVFFDVLGLFIFSFAMQVFFVTAGFSAAMMLKRRGARGLLKNRWNRIFLPFLIAYVVLTPLTRVAYRFARNAAADQSLQAGIDAVMRSNWLHWSKLYHLWFLPALLFFTLLALGLHYLLQNGPPRIADQVAASARRFLASRWRAALLALFLAPAIVTAYLFELGGVRYSMLGIALFGYFALGWLLARQRDLLPMFRQQAWVLLGIALLFIPVTVWAARLRFLGYGDAGTFVNAVAGIGNTILPACMTFGLLGLFQARLNRPSALWRYFSDASYWIYLIHMPFVVAVGGALSVIAVPAVLKYLVTVAVVLPLVIGTYHYGVRRSPLGNVLIGGRKNREGPA